ncbi:MAG: prolyl oligopeptidase family serine peptidase [Ignavibacteriales bacterium]|nr:prolyl oligopeptidase family serine peptidase [Ignavibacteriales bacterium]
MNRFFAFVALLAGAASLLVAQLPPLIDREIFFGDPEISAARISPDGNYITFVKPFNNIRNIWVKERTEPFEKARPLTADSLRPVTAYFWSHDSRLVLFVQDKGGDENFRVYAVDPNATADPVPPARDLTPLENVRAIIYDVPRGSPNEIIVGLNDRNPQLHDVHRINLTTGERTLLRKNEENIAGWSTDLKGELRLGTRVTQDGGTEILKLEGDELVSVYTVTSEESAGPIRFTPDGNSFYLATNKGKADKIQLELYDLKTRKTKLVEKDPENEVDFAGALFSDQTEEILATYYFGDRRRTYPRQKAFARDYERLKKAVPEGETAITSMTDDESVWLVSVSRDVDPGSVYVFDRAAGTAELLYRSRPNLPSEHLAPMKPVRYKARDGLTIPAYLTLPKGIPSKKLPVVMLIHGGPWSRDTWGYDALAQFLANRGYAVLQPNFRGSAGYGKKFLNAGNKQWGTGSMQHDITDGVKYLIKEGVADPKLVAISGGSYGGYATLAGLAFTPDLYAAGFDIVGPSNIITLLNSIPPYWAPIQKIFAVRVGDKDDPRDRKVLEAQSPLNSATKIKAPLYVVQGANDPRVKKAESDQIVAALRELGRQVEYMVAPDEGHGFRNKENRLAMFTAMEHFLAKHIGGRIQESISPDVKQKLDAITIDIKAVIMPKRETTDEPAPSAASFDGNRIQGYDATYSTKMNMMGREIALMTARSVSKATHGGKSVWRIIDQTTGPMGSGGDTLDVDAATLLPVRRSVSQGMGSIALNFTSDAVEGTISGPGMSMPVNIELSQPVLTDGAGTEVAVSSLPLKEGYTTTIYTLDIMGGKAKAFTLRVTGSEQVTVTAGTFDAYRVELTPQGDEDGGMVTWIGKENKRTVKVEAKLPAQMGGGTAMGELVK